MPPLSTYRNAVELAVKHFRSFKVEENFTNRAINILTINKTIATINFHPVSWNMTRTIWQQSCNRLKNTHASNQLN